MKKLTRTLVLVIAVAMLLSSFAIAETPAHPNSLIFAMTTELSGDWGRQIWTDLAADHWVYNLTNDYDIVVADQGGQNLINPTIVADYTSEMNEDGSKTFTVTINDGLVYNTGDAITAKDFVNDVLFRCSPVANNAGTKATNYIHIVGGKDYFNGDADKVAGLRLIDDLTFSITIVPEDIPYFYELTYIAYSPMPIDYWLGEGVDIVDDGEGCYYTGIDDMDAVVAQVQKARFQHENVKSAGPYSVVDYDPQALTCTVEINPLYAGNFEGQKPTIEKLTIVRAVEETWADAMKTGAIEFYDTITDGAEINTAMDMVEQGGFDYTMFTRAGYGYITIQCDFSPTQFVAVRQAMCYLLDRVEFANTFCQGYGGVVYGPYGLGFWQYQESEELFAEELNPYAYDPETAVQLLIDDGWVYAADGSDYVEGIRYKKVTPEEAGTYEHNVTLDDGTILMPCIIEWSCSEGNAVSDLIAVMLAENPDLQAAGMQINRNEMSFTELINYITRDATVGEQYAVPKYSMYNLGNTWADANYSAAYSFTSDPDYVAKGYNGNYLFDDELDRLSMDMVYGTEPDDVDKYLDLYQQYVIRWNEMVPAIPLYSNEYISLYPDWLENFEEDSFWPFEHAILYAYIDGYEPAE